MQPSGSRSQRTGLRVSGVPRHWRRRSWNESKPPIWWSLPFKSWADSWTCRPRGGPEESLKRNSFGGRENWDFSWYPPQGHKVWNFSSTKLQGLGERLRSSTPEGTHLGKQLCPRNSSHPRDTHPSKVQKHASASSRSPSSKSTAEGNKINTL